MPAELHEYDDNCPDCQPCLIDIKNGKPMKEDHPALQMMRKVFKEKTTLAERRAFHRISVGLSQSPVDLKIAQRVAGIIQEALKELENDQNNESIE